MRDYCSVFYSEIGRATRLDLIGEVDGDVDRQVDLTGRKRGHAGELILDWPEDDLGELRRIAPVARIRLERQAVILAPLAESVRAGSNRLAGEAIDADLLEVAGGSIWAPKPLIAPVAANQASS